MCRRTRAAPLRNLRIDAALLVLAREKDFGVVFPEADPVKVEEIPSEQVSCDFSIAESNREPALTEVFVCKLNAMGYCHDIRSRCRPEVNLLSVPWLQADGTGDLAVEERPLRSGIEVSLDFELTAVVWTTHDNP
jgi:hypothetical protein